MSKKITLSELKVKSSVIEINAQGKKSTKGGHIRNNQSNGGGRIKINPNGNWIADTIVDIRLTTNDNDGGDFNP
ncbi:MAG: hypothetical protein ACJAT4_000626 [Granulosicoccus sp.]|jgi:hypothetical protein